MCVGLIPNVGPAIEEPGNLVSVVEDFDLEVLRFLGRPLHKEGRPITRQDRRSRSIGTLNVGQQIIQITNDRSRIFVRTSGYHLSDSPLHPCPVFNARAHGDIFARPRLARNVGIPPLATVCSRPIAEVRG